MLETKDDGNNFSYINYQNKCKQTKQRKHGDCRMGFFFLRQQTIVLLFMSNGSKIL